MTTQTHPVHRPVLPPLGVQDMLGASDGRIYLVATQGFTTHALPDLAPYTRIRVD